MEQKNQTTNVLDKINPQRILLVVLTVIAAGAIFYRQIEGWSWIDSVYFCVATLATVGYGDLTPTTDLGKIFTCFYILIGVGILTAGIGYLARYAVQRHLDRKQHSK